MAATAAKQDVQPKPESIRESSIPDGMRAPHSPRPRSIYQRMNAVMKDVRGVGKHSHNQQGNYRYAGHEAVTDALRDAYVKHGIVRTASVVKTEVLDRGTLLLHVRVAWICDDDPHSRHEVDVPGLQSSVKKDGGMAPVQVGMALSYAVKNAEFKCFALTGDDTPDTEAADDDRGEPVGNDSGDEPNGLVVEYLARFAGVRTAKELESLKQEIRKNWSAVKHVRDIAERMVVAQRRAAERIRQQERQPGED